MPAKTSIDLVAFTPGKHRANDGTFVTLDMNGLQDLVRNTKYIIGKKILAHPPVGYKHPASQDGNARGHIGDASYIDGAAMIRIDQPKFMDDVKNGNRLDYSPEIGYVDYTEAGATKRIGPAIVGVAILGEDRPGIKDPKRIPLSQLVFAEGMSDVQAFVIQEELRKTGFVAQNLDGDGAYCFSEATFNPAEFREEEPQMPLTAEDLAQIKSTITTVVKDEVKPISDKVETLEKKTGEAVKQFSEAAKNESRINTALDNIRADKRHLGKSAMDNLEKLFREPSFETAKAFAESIPATLITRGSDSKKKDGDDDEPREIAVIRPEDFSNQSAPGIDARLSAGLKKFSEYQPDMWAVVKDKKREDQLDALRTYIVKRDAASN